MKLRLRAMTSAEFESYRARSIVGYAATKVRSGDWGAETAVAQATRETDRLLPGGADTPGMLLLVAEIEREGRIGTAWLALESPDRSGAWIYDIEVVSERQGEGYGRAFLLAVEQLASQHGVDTIGLNVFGDNDVARDLYESCGYEVTSRQMRKLLGDA